MFVRRTEVADGSRRRRRAARPHDDCRLLARLRLRSGRGTERRGGRGSASAARRDRRRFHRHSAGWSVNGWDVGETSRATHPTIPVVYTSGAASVRERPVRGKRVLRQALRPRDRAGGLPDPARSNNGKPGGETTRSDSVRYLCCSHSSNCLDFHCGGRASAGGGGNGRAASDFIQILLMDEIRRVVAEAIETGSIVSAAAVAEQLKRTYVNCGLSENEIADQVMIAAAKSGLAVEIGGERMIANPGRAKGTFSTSSH